MCCFSGAGWWAGGLAGQEQGAEQGGAGRCRQVHVLVEGSWDGVSRVFFSLQSAGWLHRVPGAAQTDVVVFPYCAM